MAGTIRLCYVMESNHVNAYVNFRRRKPPGPVRGYSCFLSLAVLKHPNRSSLREERVCLMLPGHSPSGEELNHELEAENMEGFFLLAQMAHGQLTFLYSLKPPA